MSRRCCSSGVMLVSVILLSGVLRRQEGEVWTVLFSFLPRVCCVSECGKQFMVCFELLSQMGCVYVDYESQVILPDVTCVCVREVFAVSGCWNGVFMHSTFLLQGRWKALTDISFSQCLFSADYVVRTYEGWSIDRLCAGVIPRCYLRVHRGGFYLTFS